MEITEYKLRRACKDSGVKPSDCLKKIRKRRLKKEENEEDAEEESMEITTYNDEFVYTKF